MPTSTYPSVIERYYKKFFDKREDRPSEDVCVLAHSNKVCVVTLCPDHKALKDGPIQSLKYVVETGGKKVGDVHGKRKLQAIKLRGGMPLCEITSGDGTTYTVKCPVRGKLCELNEKLLNDLTLLQKMPETNGYLAIILHHSCDEKDLCSYLLTEEQYLNGEVINVNRKETAGGDEVQEETMDKDQESLGVTNAEVPKPTDENDMKLADKNGMGENMKVDEVVDDKQKSKSEITKDDEATLTEEKKEDDEEERNTRGKRRGGTRNKKTPAKKARK